MGPASGTGPLQGQVLTEVSVPPQVHFSLFPFALNSQTPAGLEGLGPLTRLESRKKLRVPSGTAAGVPWKRPEGYLV